MPTYTVRIKHELVRYVEIEIEAENMYEASNKIDDIPMLETAESLATPGNWDIEEDNLIIEKIIAQDGTVFLDTDALYQAWEQEEEQATS